MFTSPVDFTRRSAAFLLHGLALGAALTALGCNKSETPAETPATAFCNSLSEYVGACAAAATPCDQAMIQDCAGVTALVSDGFLRTASDCVRAGGSPFTCLAGAIGGLTPSAAHEAFATQFCDECAFGVGGCADTLLGRAEGSAELAAVSVVLLPLGDGLVDALRERCATGLGCLATFPTCAQGVLAEQAIPEQTLQCLLDSFAGMAPDAPAPAEDTAACGLTGGPDTGGATATGSASTTNGSNASSTTAGEATTQGENPTSTDPGTTTTTTGEATTSTTTGEATTSTSEPDPSSTGSTTSDEWEQMCAGPFDEHNECSAGGPLPEDCTWCTYLICNYIDESCCTTAWTSECAIKANQHCNLACGADFSLCAHDVCTIEADPAPLEASCSDCVMGVCATRPACCDVDWDLECVHLAMQGCGAC